MITICRTRYIYIYNLFLFLPLKLFNWGLKQSDNLSPANIQIGIPQWYCIVKLFNVENPRTNKIVFIA